MVGIFNVPGAGIQGASLDEVLKAAMDPAGPLGPLPTNVDREEEKASTAIELMRSIVAEHPGRFSLVEPLLSAKALTARDKLTAIFNAIPDPRQRRSILHKVQRHIQRQEAALASNKAATDRIVDWLRVVEVALTEASKWGTTPPLRLERPTTTMSHQLLDAIRAGRAVDVTASEGRLAAEDRDLYLQLFEPASVFMIEHDWAAAFRGAQDFDGGEIRLPDDSCMFEMRVNGCPVVVMASVIDGAIKAMPVVLTPSGTWVASGFATRFADGSWGSKTDKADAMLTLLTAQITAVCIALDARVAQTEVVRAPHKLNQARERRGKLPVFDYHVVSLARRSRAARLPIEAGAEPGPRRRLHFRRGHWRHYPNHKTWINWMLIGDPDLGFVDKHYKL